MDLDAYMLQLSERGRWSGSVLVRRNGKTLLDASYGLAERERERPNTPETTFQIASVSKQFTAAAVLLLQERGALAMHDPLCRWLPGCPESWRAIALHHLLTHTSGIGHWHDFPALSLYHPIARTDLLDMFQRLPLKFAPGAGWAYSSPGYVLLAQLVEQVTGEQYPEFLRRAIFMPLGMASAGAGNRAPNPASEAVGYASKQPLPSFDLDTVSIGAGDVWTTARDLARWDAALMMPGSLLTADSLRAMFAPYASVGQDFFAIPGASYGYGWFVAEMSGQSVYVHSGDNAGFGALNIMLPGSDSVVILLGNDEDADLVKIGRRVLWEEFGVV